MGRGPDAVPLELQRASSPVPLKARQQTALELVERYYAAANELPSCRWLANRLHVSRKRAHDHLDALRRKRWLDR